MRCRKVQKLLSVSLDRELDEAQAQAMKTHLAGCSDCQRFQQELMTCQHVILRWEVPEPRPGFTSRLMSRLPEGSGRWVWWKEWREALRPVPALAAAIALCFGVLLALSMNGQTDLQVSIRDDSEEAPYAEPFEPVPGYSLGAFEMALLEGRES